jgi:hypothetical protein
MAIVTAHDALVVAQELLDTNRKLFRNTGLDLDTLTRDPVHPDVVAAVTIRAAQAQALSAWAAAKVAVEG